ncbi:MAG: class I SAM-dependent methyltransferase [Microcoleaceae cyanobacterium]
MSNRYDNIAPYYDLLVQKGYYDYVESSKSLHSIIKDRKKILEIGVGTGLLAEQLLALNPNYDLTGIDITPAMLDIAKSRLGGKAKLLESDVLSMDFPESFDVIYSHAGPIGFGKAGEVLQFGSFLLNLEDNLKALKKIADCLVPLGLLVVDIERIESHNNRVVDFEQELENGIVYSHTVRESLIEGKEMYFVDKEYFFKKGDRILARDRAKFFRVYGQVLEDLLMKAGFELNEDASNNLYLVYQKVN